MDLESQETTAENEGETSEGAAENQEPARIETQQPNRTVFDSDSSVTADVWKEIVSVGIEEDGKERGRCIHCCKKFVINKHNGTSSLRRHLLSHCSKKLKNQSRSNDGASVSESSGDREGASNILSKKRQRSSVSEGTTSSALLRRLDVLDCPVCFEALTIPIFQCDNGHLSCSPCCEKVKNICPSCKLPIGYSRCRAIERVIEASSVSCPNTKYGCKENSVFGNSHSHEMQCFFTACSCPMRDCDYTGSYKNLYIHVSAIHKNDLILFTWDTSLNVPWSLSKKITVFQEEKDGELVVVQVFSGLHGLTVSASCIAPLAPIQGIISCSMKLGNSAVRLKQALMLKKIQKVSDDEEPEDGFMLIPSYLLPSDGNWKMRICISRGLTRVNHL